MPPRPWFSGQAAELHMCAQRVNDLRKQLEATPIHAPEQLLWFIRTYDAHIKDCRPNHDEIDYEIARRSGSAVDGDASAGRDRTLIRLRRKNAWKTYWPYVVVAIAPVLAGLAAWVIVPVPVGK